MIKRKQPIVYDRNEVYEALVQLCYNLNIQRHRFTDGQNPDSDRKAAVHSIAAVMDFLKAARPQAPELRDVFSWLLDGLDNRRGKARDLRDEARWATAAAVISLYEKDHSIPPEKTAIQLENIFKVRGVPLPGGVREGSKLLNYRKEITRRRGQNSPGAGLYREAIELARAYAGSRESAANRLRDVLVATMLDAPVRAAPE